MKEFVVYVKARKDVLCSVFGSMFLIEISGVIILSHLMRQWSYDMHIESLHMVLGGFCLCGEMILLYLLFRKLMPGGKKHSGNHQYCLSE